MTKLAILADIHGNLPALEAALADVAQFEIDRVIVAGDTINWGPSSTEVLERLAREDAVMIRGNNEYYLLDHDTPRAPNHWRDYVMNPWLHRQLDGYWLSRIAAWPEAIQFRYPDAPPLHVTHGWPDDIWTGIYPQTPDEEIVERLSRAGVDEETFVTAHIHLAIDRRAGRWRVLNPGSVGAPLDGKKEASYMILEGDADGWHPTFQRLAFDDAPLYEAFERARFVETCGPEALLVIEEFKLARLRLLPYQRWRQATHNGTPTSMALVEKFLSLDEAAYRAYTPPAYHLNMDNMDGHSVIK